MPDPQKVFKVEREGNTLIVLPQGPALHFQHNEVHLESNELYRALDGPGMLHVVIDMQAVDYVDSVIISSILRCLTKCKQRRGKSVFCNASENMTELLKCIRLGKLWPSFDSREESLEAVNS
jgi:anti-sigma B factor antagonist